MHKKNTINRLAAPNTVAKISVIEKISSKEKVCMYSTE
jgi:hypothetical protein